MCNGGCTLSILPVPCRLQCSGGDVTWYSRHTSGRSGWIEHDSFSRNGQAICKRKYWCGNSSCADGSEAALSGRPGRVDQVGRFQTAHGVGEAGLNRRLSFRRKCGHDIGEGDGLNQRHAHELPAAGPTAGLATDPLALSDGLIDDDGRHLMGQFAGRRQQIQRRPLAQT